MSVSSAPRAVAWTPSRLRGTRARFASARGVAPRRGLCHGPSACFGGEDANLAADKSLGYHDLLDEKVRRTRALFGDLLPPGGLEVYASPKTTRFRHRCRFAVVRENEGGGGEEKGASDADDDACDEDGQTTIGKTKKNELRYALFEKGNVAALDVYSDFDFFPPASHAIADVMPKLLRVLNEEDSASNTHTERTSNTQSGTNTNPLTDGLSAVGFLANRRGDVVVTLWNASEAKIKENEPAYPLTQQTWDIHACRLVDALKLTGLVSRRKGKVWVASNGTGKVFEEMRVPRLESALRNNTHTNPSPESDTIILSIVEGAFSNPNPDVAECTAGWLRETVATALSCREELDERATGERGQKSKKKSEDVSLVELYCGNGTHTVNLSPFFHKVTAVEIEPRLCDACLENFALNGIENARVMALPAETFSEERIDDTEIPTNDDFVLVDPPRAGLDPVTLRMVASYRTIIYIACDSNSLVRDFVDRGLAETHSIKRSAVFDHFPGSKFVEVVVWLERRRDASA
jgi:tRNA/tmRNA/rRNA uracil-C5-methylase (TrmA/RlmC/RlmD family)